MYSTPPQGNYNIGSLCESLLDVLDIALVVFDADGALVHFNRHAQHVLSQGASIQMVGGQLRGRPEDRSALLALARDCAGAAGRDGPSKCFRIPREDRQPLILSMTGIRLEQEGGAVALAVGVLHDPEHRTVLEPMELAARYGLTPAEARVAAATGDGKVAKVIARDLDVSLTTVRTHLKSIYAKLSVRNANELIALLRGAVFHRPFEAGATRRRAMAAAPDVGPAG